MARRARRSARSLALRRYWRSVKIGRRYRRLYTERHFTKAVVRRLKPPRRPPRKPKPKPAPKPTPWVSMHTYQKSVDLSVKPPIESWRPHPRTEFLIDWVLPSERFGATIKRLPKGRFMPSRVVFVYFLVEGYLRGQVGWNVVGYRLEEEALAWTPRTLSRWWAFIREDVWEYILAYIDQRNQVEGSSWEVSDSADEAIVLWHFVKEGDYGKGGTIYREKFRREEARRRKRRRGRIIHV